MSNYINPKNNIFSSVVRQSERHLDKITNVDEFVKRVFSVIHSNDPIARALTLRTLGAVANIIPERRQAHHNIRSALDSQDAIELRAAIYAASRFAARSKSFAVNMCEKISDMIKGYVIFIFGKLVLQNTENLGKFEYLIGFY